MAHNATQPPLPDYDQALQTILMHAPRLRTERVALSEVLGRVLRQDVAADRDQPPFDRSAMDGFAVRSESFDRATCYTVIGSVAAGAPIGTFDAAADQVVRIATGAPVPAGFDAVVPIEQADVQCNGDAERVRFRVESCQPWKNVHRCASDATRGQVVLRAGTRLAPHHVGIAAAVGATQLDVAERPRICVLTSGDEVQPTEVAADQLEPQQIRNSNGPMLASFFEVLGTPVLDCVHIPDEPEQTLAATREALGHSHLVVTVGGVSVGQRDLLPWAWQRLGLETVLHGIAMQPGRPVFVATPSDKDAKDNKLVIGLPGNPVSVLATAHLIVWPVLRRMWGLTHRNEQAALPWRIVALAEQVKPNARRQVFRAARLLEDGTASVIGWHGSGDLMHTAGADGWVRLPVQSEPVPAGQRVPWLAMVT